MGTDTDILQAGFDILSNMDDIDPALISWDVTTGPDGKPFKPPHTTTPHLDCWYEFKWFPNEPESVFWGNDSPENQLGFFQVLVYYRPGYGPLFAVSQAELIKEEFKKGTDIGPIGTRKQPWLSPSVVDGSEAFIPVTIPYYGLAA